MRKVQGALRSHNLDFFYLAQLNYILIIRNKKEKKKEGTRCPLTS
jgi:molybdate-binding protein